MTTAAWNGHRLREHREAAGLSQTDLARLADMTQSMISGYESGRRVPNAESLIALTTALRSAGVDVSADDLLGIGSGVG